MGERFCGKKYFYFFSYLFLVFVLVFFGRLTSVLAFGVSPLRQVVSLDAGQKSQVYLDVKNNTDKKIRVNLRVTGVKQGEKGQTIFADNSDYAETWVSPEKNIIEIEPGETAKPIFHIRVSDTAETKLHYLGLMVSMESAGEQVISIFPEVASYLLIQVAGTVREQLQIVGWNLSKKIVFASGNLPINLTVRNSGTAAIPVFVDISAVDLDGNSILAAKKNINSIPPGTLRTGDFNLALDNKISTGVYDVKANLRYGNFGAQQLPALRFFYISSSFCIWSVLTILLIVVLGIYLRHRHKK